MAWETLGRSLLTLALLLVALPAMLGNAGPGTAAVGNGSVNVVVEQDGEMWAGAPVLTDETAIDWYNYDRGSSHNPTGLGDAGESHLFLLDSQDGMSLGVLHNVHGAGPSGYATLAFDGLPSGSWVVEDDPNEVTTYPTPSWGWAPERGDGGLFQAGFAPGMSVTVEPSWDSWDPTWQFASGADGSRQITLDQTAPVTMTVCPDRPSKDVIVTTLEGQRGDNGWFTADPVEPTLDTVTDSTCDRTTERLDYRIDDGPIRTYDGTLHVAGDGNHTLAVWAVDVDGDRSLPVVREVKIDTTPPTVEVADPAPGEMETQGQEVATPMSEELPPIVVGDTTVRANASDATSGVRYAWLDVDGTGYSSDRSAPYLFPWDAGEDAAGPHNVTTLAIDQAGLVSADSREVWSVPTGPGGVIQTLLDPPHPG